MLFPKNRDNFKEDNITDKVIDTRYYHYESKRKQLLQEIYDYLKGVNMRGTYRGFMRR